MNRIPISFHCNINSLVICGQGDCVRKGAVARFAAKQWIEREAHSKRQRISIIEGVSALYGVRLERDSAIDEVGDCRFGVEVGGISGAATPRTVDGDFIAEQERQKEPRRQNKGIRETAERDCCLKKAVCRIIEEWIQIRDLTKCRVRH